MTMQPFAVCNLNDLLPLLYVQQVIQFTHGSQLLP